jgi:uncharacterized membrane protein
MTISAGRQAYLDRVRGLAVLIMIEAHVLDSWTHSLDRSRPAFGYATILGGFGAPLFLFLAGVSLVLSAQSKFRRTGDADAAWAAVRKRGWQIFGLAFLFRLQSYILTAGNSAGSLLRVDILNVMGPAIVLAAAAGARASSPAVRLALFAAIACAASMVTPLIRSASLAGWVPTAFEAYLRPVPGLGGFSLFPWGGFVFAGAAAGVAIDKARLVTRSARFQLGLGGIAIAIVSLSYAAGFLPSLYPRSDFWTSSPAFFFLRVGVLLLVLPLAYLWEHAPWRGAVSGWSPVQELGRASLFVYWIHVEMVYGFPSRPLRRALSLEEAALAAILLTAFLLTLVMLKNRLVESRRVVPRFAVPGPNL